MSTSYSIRAVRDDVSEIQRGTAWFLDCQTLVTAFHVVGNRDSGEWLHQALHGLQYRLDYLGQELPLQALARDMNADVALLRVPKGITPLPSELILASAIPERGDTWHGSGYPQFHDGAFGLSGSVTQVHGDARPGSLQLLLNESTRGDWKGISGTPVQVDDRVVGLITQVTADADTCWAAPALAIARLEAASAHPPVPTTQDRDELLADVLQELNRSDALGVALLEPLRYGARGLVDRVIAELQRPGRRLLVAELTPDPDPRDEQQLYGALYRDLRRGLKRSLGGLSPAWTKCLTVADRVDKAEFSRVLEDLLEGPVEEGGYTLALVVAGLSTVSREQCQHWGWMMQRLRGPLKLLVWGGEELYQLCTVKTLGQFSVFHSLKRLTVGHLSGDDLQRRLRVQPWYPDLPGERRSRALDLLQDLTAGHPALVGELLETGGLELQRGDRDGLRLRALTGPFLTRQVRDYLNDLPRAREILGRLQQGDLCHHDDPVEERLRWLGILGERRDAGYWQWTAPIIAEWVERWLG